MLTSLSARMVSDGLEACACSTSTSNGEKITDFLYKFKGNVMAPQVYKLRTAVMLLNSLMILMTGDETHLRKELAQFVIGSF